MWIQPEFLSISLLTPNAQRQNVLLKKNPTKTEEQCSEGCSETFWCYHIFCTGPDFIFTSYALVRAKNGTGAGSFLQL